MSKITQSFQFKNCRVDIYEEEKYLETVFNDGTKVPAAPNFDEESIARAKELGYENTWEMTRDHELLHTILYEAMGYPWSPVLYSVAHQVRFPEGSAKQEESLILCVQKLLNTWRKNQNE